VKREKTILPERQLGPDAAPVGSRNWADARAQAPRIEHELRHGWVVARGALDLRFAEHLRAVLDAALADHPPPPRISLDLSKVWLIDASVVRVLVVFHAKAAAEHCSFRVVGAEGMVRRVLEITGVLSILTD
jgi:anti-anti-sigma factor